MEKFSCMGRAAAVAFLLAGSLLSTGSSYGEESSPLESCTRAGVGALLRTHVRAYNEGDLATLDSIWASEPYFEWYSVSPKERERAEAYNRQTLLPYFGQRHLANDRLRVTSSRVGPPNELGHFGIAYHLKRFSDEVAARGRYHGKASATTVPVLPNVDEAELSRCVLIVWSMGRAR